MIDPRRNAPHTEERSLLARAWVGTSNFLGDRPGWITVILTVFVAAHAVLAGRYPWLDPFKALRPADKDATSVAVALYLGTAGAAAIIAGFAGVILVFVVGSPSPRVRAFRDSSGRPLQKTWTSVIAEPFAATLFGVIAATTQTTSGRVVAPWLFELSVVLLTHVALRLLWLLRSLVALVGAEDHEATRDEKALPLDEIFGR